MVNPHYLAVESEIWSAWWIKIFNKGCEAHSPKITIDLLLQPNTFDENRMKRQPGSVGDFMVGKSQIPEAVRQLERNQANNGNEVCYLNQWSHMT